MRNPRRRFVLAASSVAALAACGEGSNGGSDARLAALGDDATGTSTTGDGVVAKSAGSRDDDHDRGDGRDRRRGRHDHDHDHDHDDGDGCEQPGQQVRKIIIDSDYNTMSDDGQAGVMAAQLQATGQLEVLGITVVSGNKWLRQGVAEALKSVERLGVENAIPVYAGANYALNHDYAMVQAEMAAGAGGDGYLGAWSTPEPKSDADLVPPVDGFATHTQVQSQSAVDFIIDTVRANPHEVTILALGPLTNIALATRQAPDIIPLIDEIIYMGGAVHVPGNTTLVAEFNWWFDPDAAREVLRLPIRHIVLPLDVTDTVPLTHDLYERVAFPPDPTAVTAAYRAEWFAPLFEQDPTHTSSIWDTLTVAYLIDPTFATEVTKEYLDVVVNPGGVDNGQSIGYRRRPRHKELQKVTVVRRFDNARFDELYVDLLTRPVPVTLPSALRRDASATRLAARDSSRPVPEPAFRRARPDARPDAGPGEGLRAAA